jgi:CRP/FNR family cyclic AMP-dependent transcriptional regulator
MFAIAWRYDASADERPSSASQDKLALMLGVSRPTLNRELQILAKMGPFSLHYGHVEIKDMGLLIGGGNPL